MSNQNQPVPYSQEAEEATLGGILINPSVFSEIALFLNADDFLLLRHRYIWQAITRLSEDNQAIDNLTVAESLKSSKKLDEIGGAAYLTQLMNSTPSSARVGVYAKIVQDAAIRRNLIFASDQIKALALNEDLKTDEVCIQAQQRVDEIQPVAKEHVLAGDNSIAAYHDVQKKLAQAVSEGHMVAYRMPRTWTGIADFIPAFYPGDFVVISGQEGSGKSSAMEELGEHFAGLGLWVSYIHTEQSTEQLLHRRMARHSGLSFHLLAAGGFVEGQVAGFTPEQRQKMNRADEQIAIFAKRLTYEWMPDVEFSRLQNKMKRAAAAGVKVFLIDHFQDIQFPPLPGKQDNNPVRAYEKACVWLAAFAEFRKVLVIVASQENQQGRTMWSSKLLQKALTRISIKRKDLDSEYSYWIDGVEYRSLQGEASPQCEWWITKARFGKKGKVKMINHGPRFSWIDYHAVQRVPEYKQIRRGNPKQPLNPFSKHVSTGDNDPVN